VADAFFPKTTPMIDAAKKALARLHTGHLFGLRSPDAQSCRLDLLP